MLIDLDQIGPELIEHRVDFRIGAITEPEEMQEAGRRYRDFGRAACVAPDEFEFAKRNRVRAAQRSDGKTGVPVLRVAGFVAKFENRLTGIESVERADETGGPRDAAELTVGD